MRAFPEGWTDEQKIAEAARGSLSQLLQVAASITPGITPTNKQAAAVKALSQNGHTLSEMAAGRYVPTLPARAYVAPEKQP